MGSCSRGRAIRQWRKLKIGDHVYRRLLVSLVVAGTLIAAMSLLLPEPRDQSAGTPSEQSRLPDTLEARLAEQAEVAAESREALALLRRELEQLRQDYQALQSRHEEQRRELEATREQLRSLRAQDE